jgi:DNA modification methylase
VTARILHGDCRQVLAELPDNSIDAIVTDPPYEIAFMGKGWDAAGVAFDPALWGECLRVLKPGGHLLAFGGTRTYHRMTVAIEDAGFEIRDCIAWKYDNKTMPKSLDVSKAIDKQRHDRADIYKVTAWVRAARDAAGVTNRDIDNAFGANGMGRHWTDVPPHGKQPAVPTLDQVPTLLDVLGVTADEVPADIRRLLWDLNGRKGQPGENWAKREVVGVREVPIAHGFAGPTYGGDSSRHVVAITTAATDASRKWVGWGTALRPGYEPIVMARHPFTGTVAQCVLNHGTGALNIQATRDADGRWPRNRIMVPKPHNSERNAGLDAPNHHPTVKPVALMRWLVRLVTPPGGVVLDPFTGSGTTGVAATLEGFDFVGCEMTDDYLPIIEGRLAWAAAQVSSEEPPPPATPMTRPAADDDHPTLFDEGTAA